MHLSKQKDAITRLIHWLSFGLPAALLAGSICYGQTFSASIAGTISDPGGGLVNGAQVHLKNIDTNDTRDTVSSGEGTYKFDNLLPGRYQITAEARGFKTHVQNDMILRAN